MGSEALVLFNTCVLRRPQGDGYRFTFPPAVPADWAATAPEAGWATAELVWAVMVDLALVLPLEESLLLQPFAVNLINAHVAADKIPIFLIGETAAVRGPSKLARRFWMVGIVNRICFDSRIRRKGLSLIN